MLTEPKGALYYFKTADDPPNYKGIVNMRECKAEDVEARRRSFPISHAGRAQPRHVCWWLSQTHLYALLKGELVVAYVVSTSELMFSI